MNSIINSIYPAFSLLWGYLWLRVGIHYGKAAYLSWRSNGGHWPTLIPNLFSPLKWAFSQFFKGRGFGRPVSTDSLDEVGSVKLGISSGTVLQFSILLGTFAPGIFGLAFALSDRGHFTLQRNITVMMFIFVSCLAAGGHLFLVLRHHPEKWLRLIVGSTAFLIIFPIFLLIPR